MLIVSVLLSVVIGFVIAAGVIGREARRLGSQRREPVWRLEEAASFVEERLPLETRARLTPDDLRLLLRRHLNLLQYQAPPSAPSVSREPDAVADLYRDVRADGHELARDDIAVVVAEHLAYLTAIGALFAADDD